MAHPKGLIAALSAALLSAFVAAGPAPAREAVLTPEQMRRAAGAEVMAGRDAAALTVTEALLARDPEDVAAHLIRSRAARNLGQLDTAKRSADAAWRYAGTPDERYTAALAKAQVLASQGARTRSQLWLRRAIQIAPTEAQKARAVRDFRYVRARNKWSTNLSFSVSPSSNVNGGSSSDTSKFYGLPWEFELNPVSKALSGIEYATGISLGYTLAETELRKTELHAGAFHRTYTLSSDAKDEAPDAEGSDFAYSTVSLGLSHDWLAESRRYGGGVGATVAQAWYGGERLNRTLRVDGSLRYVFTPKTVGQAALSREWQHGFGTRDDATSWRATMGAVRVLPGDHRLGLSLSHAASASDAYYLDYEETGVSLSLALAEPVLSTSVEFGVSGARRSYYEAGVTVGGREDMRYSAQVGLVFDSLDYYGFVPSLTLRAERRESNIGLYDSEEFGAGLGIRSKF